MLTTSPDMIFAQFMEVELFEYGLSFPLHVHLYSEKIDKTLLNEFPEFSRVEILVKYDDFWCLRDDLIIKHLKEAG